VCAVTSACAQINQGKTPVRTCIYNLTEGSTKMLIKMIHTHSHTLAPPNRPITLKYQVMMETYLCCAYKPMNRSKQMQRIDVPK